MKLSRHAICIVPCLTLAFSTQAQLFTELDWQFSIAGKTNPPTQSVNPFGASATAAVVGANNTYFFGAGPDGLFGTLTGLWDVNQGQLVLATDRYALAPVNYSVTLTQFTDNCAFYPGTVQFSIPANPGVSRTVVQQQTGNMVGFWVADTYTWSQAVTGTNTVGLTIIPGTGGGGAMLLDRVQWTIAGTLTDKVPEPASGALVAAGLLAFWAHSRFRRKLSVA